MDDPQQGQQPQGQKDVTITSHGTSIHLTNREFEGLLKGIEQNGSWYRTQGGDTLAAYDRLMTLQQGAGAGTGR